MKIIFQGAAADRYDQKVIIYHCKYILKKTIVNDPQLDF